MSDGEEKTIGCVTAPALMRADDDDWDPSVPSKTNLATITAALSTNRCDAVTDLRLEPAADVYGETKLRIVQSGVVLRHVGGGTSDPANTVTKSPYCDDDFDAASALMLAMTPRTLAQFKVDNPRGYAVFRSGLTLLIYGLAGAEAAEKINKAIRAPAPDNAENLADAILSLIAVTTTSKSKGA